MPLGSGALAGTSVAIDREALAVSLGFSAVSTNSLDAVSDRDFCVEFTSAASLAMMHLSRLSEDLILYSTHEFGFVHLSDAIATGSSLMPQKKNPDALELLRGKSGRVFGHLMGTLSILKGLPLAYNKDMQEDKAAVFDTADTLRECLQVAATVLANIRVDEPRAREAASQGCMNATELADYLASQGIPFRQAHELVGKLVVLACSKGQELSSLSLGEMRAVCPLIDDEVYEVLTLHRTLASKRRTGGTAPERVSTALAKARAHHEAWRQQA
jgi:argininosuccinate lyase